MAALPNHASMSVEEYLQMDRSSTEIRYEYIDGHVRMLAGGTLNHATISFNMARILHDLLRGETCRVFTSDAHVRVSETRYVYPDVTVSCDERDRGEVDIIQSPRLIVEVLSTTTEDFDRGKKFILYRECPTIQEYVLINAKRQMIEVFRRERNDLWILQVLGPGKQVELASLDVRFPVSAVYEDVIFPEDEDAPA
jgi:Uma2 family endonuclease